MDDSTRIARRGKSKSADNGHAIAGPIASMPRMRSLLSVATLLTDTGNAANLVVRHGPNIRYCEGMGWFIYPGNRWARDERGQIVRIAKETALGIFDEAKAEENEARQKALVEHAVRSQRRDKITAMIELAKCEVPITADELDADPWLLNCPNGTVELPSRKLRPHRRDDYLTKSTRANYNPTAEAPTFEKFLERIFRRSTLIPYVQKAIGYALTGSTREQCLFFAYGTGANGKTTLFDAVLHALGDYGGKADRDLLTASDRPAHPTNIADLRGRRLMVCSETNEGSRFDESKLKDLTGETRLKARFMRQDFFEFRASHKLFLYSNHKPLVRGTDAGFWRRMRVIPFLERIGETEKDPELPAKLEAEAEGILRWAVEGCAMWLRDGLGLPDEIAEATDVYRREMDSIGGFLTDRCLYGERMTATAAELYREYTAWCEDAGEHPLSQKRLGMQLTERGLESGRCSYSGRKVWRGIGLNHSAADIS